MAVTLAEGRQQGSQWHKKKIKTKAQNNKCYREKWGLENLTLKYNQRQLREEKKNLCDGANYGKMKERTQILTCHLVSNEPAEKHFIKKHEELQ